MRERNKIREENEMASLMDLVRANGRSGRIDWLKGKMRWFVGGRYAAKIKANIEVEKTLGREQPELWMPSPAGGRDSHGYGVNLMAEEQRISMKMSQEYAKITQSGQYPALDPLMIAEREWAATNTGAARAAIGMDKDVAVESGTGVGFGPQEKQLPATQADVRRLRLLEIHRSERDIEELANEVVKDINLVCMDDYREEKAVQKYAPPLRKTTDTVITEDKEPALQNLTAAVQNVAQMDNEVPFVQAEPVAIWG